jgi:hypothetical protein
MSLTGLWKLKWWRITPLLKFTRRARPSVAADRPEALECYWQLNAPSSTVTNTLASGLRAIAAIFLRFSKGKVYDLLLSYAIRLNKVVNSDIMLTWQDRIQKLGFRRGSVTNFHLGWIICFPVCKLCRRCWKTGIKSARIALEGIQDAIPYNSPSWRRMVSHGSMMIGEGKNLRALDRALLSDHFVQGWHWPRTPKLGRGHKQCTSN